MTNLEYWAKRNAERQRRHEADAQAVLKKMNGIYADARSNIENDIFSIFGRFMSDNGLSVTDAQELLTGQDFKRWRKSLADYMKDIEAIGIDSLEGRALWLEVEVLSARSRINRLDALHALIGANMAQVAALQEKAVAEHLEALYFDDFYEGAFDFYQMGLETAVDAAENGALALSNAFVHEIITEPWSGAMFSSRIWKNEWNMAQRVSEMVGRAIIAGHSHKRIARDISEALGVDKRNAERLILTESAHVKTEADLQLFRTLDIEQVEFNVTLDSRTCTTECAHHDGEIIDMNHLKDGVNKPPLHPRCRCTLLPHNEALESVRKHGERIARNAEGDNIRVSGDVTYTEWRRKLEATIHNKDSDDVEKDNIKECKTIAQIEALIKKQGWFRKKYEDSISLEGCALETAKSVYKMLDRFYAKFPQFVGKFRYIDTKVRSKNALASCSVGSGRPVLHLNTDYYKDASKIAELYELDVKRNGSPAGTDWEAVIVHELGHAIDDYMTNALGFRGTGNGRSTRYFSAALRKKTLKTMKLNQSAIAENVSIYATQDNLEWMAECFAEYFYSKDPRPMAAEFGRQLEAALKEVK